MEADFDRPDNPIFLKAVVNGKIIGSIRGWGTDETVFLWRQLVHPYFRGRGIGRRLLEEIMKAYPTAKRFQARTGHKSERNLYQLRKLGFKEYKTEPLTPNINWVYLEKICQ
ncbi:MAG TPA: GNAT family N-acetyltransferase [Verrucomicrobiae bacterium]